MISLFFWNLGKLLRESGQFGENIVEPNLVLLEHIVCLFFRIGDPVTDKLGGVSNFGKNRRNTQEGCYIILSLTTEVFASDLILWTSLHAVRESGLLLDLCEDWGNLWSSAFDLEGPLESWLEAVEIDDESQLLFDRLEEIADSCSLLLTEWRGTSIEFIAKITLTPEVLSIVSVQIDSLFLRWASSLCNGRWVTNILSLLNNLQVVLSLCVIFFDKCKTIDVDNRNEIILVLFEHLNGIWILVHNTALEQSEKRIEGHLNGDKFTSMVGSRDKDSRGLRNLHQSLGDLHI